MIKTSLTLIASLSLGAAHADDIDQLRSEPHPSLVRAITGTYSGTRELVQHALTFLNVRYRWGGDSPQTGFDCSGLVRYVVQHALGLVLPREARAMARVGEAISREELRPGDLVFFNTRRRPYSHVGIYVGDRRFIHAGSRGGRVEVVDMRADYWQRRYNGARRLAI
jgi:cell wall-associated NlpC family hydrolase